MKIYKCDVCKKDVNKENLFCLVIYKKGVSRKAGSKSENSRDICKDCWSKLFG